MSSLFGPKLVLGTVQFGGNYGVSNALGKPNITEISNILNVANQIGICQLDTAQGYGQAEELIGQLSEHRFEINSKITLPETDEPPSPSDILSQIDNSLKALKSRNLKALYIHNPNVLMGEQGGLYWEIINSAKSQGLFSQLGYSVYEPSQLDKLYSQYRPDIVQLPVNAFDSRFQLSGWVDRIKKDKVELHIRSIFLQGLLLMAPNERPKYFSNWRQTFALWDKQVLEAQVTKLEACFGAINHLPINAKLIVGVQNAKQLEAVAYALGQAKDLSFQFRTKNHAELIDPRRWPTF